MVWYDIITLGDYGWFGQLVPLVLCVGVSYWLSRKDSDFIFILFPITLVVKIILPEFSAAWVLLAFGLFALNLLGSKGDAFKEMKSQATPMQAKLWEGVKGTGRGVKKVSGLIGNKVQERKERITSMEELPYGWSIKK